MRIGIGVGIGFGRGGWTPAALAGLAAWYTAGPQWCFTDAAGTVPAGDGDPVYVWKDRGGGGWDLSQATEANRPTLRLVSGAWVVRADGVNDVIINASFTPAVKLWSVGANRISTTGATSGISTLIGDNTSDARNLRTNSATAYRGFASGVSANGGDANDHSAGGDLWVNKVISGAYAVGTPHVVTTDRGTPAAYAGLRLFARANGDRLYNGEIYELVGTTATLSAAERAALETYLGVLAGLSI